MKSIKVYAKFNAEIYELFYMDGTRTGITAVSYEDVLWECKNNNFCLVQVIGFED